VRKGAAVTRRLVATAVLAAGAWGLSAQPAVDPIRLEGRLTQSEATTKDSIGFWLNVRNNTGLPISLTQLDALDGAVLRSVEAATAPIAAGSAFAVRGVLTLTTTGERPVSLRLHWTDGRHSSTAVVPVGTVTIRTPFRDFLSHVRDVARDFGLPVVVLLLGYLFQQREKKRAEVAETWNQMLPLSHRYAMRHYLLIASAAGKAATFIELWRKEASDATAREAYMYVLLLLVRIRRLTRQVGGIYFKNRIGEAVANRCLKEVDTCYLSKVLPDRIESMRRHTVIMDVLVPNESVHSFLLKMEGGAAPRVPPKTAQEIVLRLFETAEEPLGLRTLRGLYPDFVKWLPTNEAEKGASYLHLLAAVMRFEMNRPFERWYGEREEIYANPVTERAIGLMMADITAEIKGADEAGRPDRALRSRRGRIVRYFREAGVPRGRLGGWAADLKARARLVSLS
jgi:hypothetical protein